jgi:hypothetical protein
LEMVLGVFFVVFFFGTADFFDGGAFFGAAAFVGAAFFGAAFLGATFFFSSTCWYFWTGSAAFFVAAVLAGCGRRARVGVEVAFLAFEGGLAFGGILRDIYAELVDCAFKKRAAR